jgi:hypothetical protein
MSQDQDGAWHYEEDDRSALHEAGHGLVNLVFLGNPGRIELVWGHGGLCKSVWDPYLNLDDSNASLLLYAAHSRLAGYEAEELAFPTANLRGCSDDLAVLAQVFQALPAEGITLQRQTAALVVRFLLKVYARPWRALASSLQLGTVMSDQAMHRLLSYDNSQTLCAYAEEPMIKGPCWRQKWERLRDAAARDHARAYVERSA